MANKKNVIRGANTIEALSGDFRDGLVNESKAFGGNFLKQLLGVDLPQNSENNPEATPASPLKSGEVFNISSLKRADMPERKKRKENLMPGIDYLGELREQKVSKQEMRELSTRVDDIMIELRKLVSSSKILEVQFAQVTVEQRPTEVGKYHLNFLEWLLITIKAARERVEDSSRWVSAVKGKNGKKHWKELSQNGANTHQTLNNERTVATQTG